MGNKDERYVEGGGEEQCLQNVGKEQSVQADDKDQYLQPQRDLLPSEEIKDSNSLDELEFILNDHTVQPNVPSNTEAGKLAFSYFAGYVCQSSKIQVSRNALERELPSNLWIRLKDLGGLYYPEQEHLNFLQQFEIIFFTVHKNDINLKFNVIKDFIALLEDKYPNLKREFIVKYSRARLFLRLKYLQKYKIEANSTGQSERGRKKKKQLSRC